MRALTRSLELSSLAMFYLDEQENEKVESDHVTRHLLERRGPSFRVFQRHLSCFCLWMLGSLLYL